MIASNYGHTAIVQLLVEAGAGQEVVNKVRQCDRVQSPTDTWTRGVGSVGIGLCR